MSLPKKLVASRLIAAKKRPYFSLALFALTPLPRPGLKTMACDNRYRLYYDPIVLTEWSEEEIAGVLIHEVGHILRKHHFRCEKLNANSKLWNIAGDAEINDDLISEGFKLPGSPITPMSLKLPNGRLAEEYYLALLKQQQNKQQPNNESQSKPEDEERVSVPGSGNCGSCASSRKQDYEADEEEAPGLSPLEQMAVEEKVAKQILHASKTRGNIAGGWERWANQRLHPKADWKRVLASLISSSLRITSGANDYSYARPNRRQVVYGNVVMPSLVAPEPNITVLIDTSASMSDAMMCQAMAEIESILKRNGQKLHLLSCDSKVHFNKKISTSREAKLLGGGGTDMRVGIRKALETKPKPDVIIIITDGYTDWPSQEPKKTKLIAALTCPNVVPTWIKKVELFD